MDKIQILELFGGIGAPRCALRNLGVDVKAIDYVEIDYKAVRSYNSMFQKELAYKTQSVVGYNLKPDILIHGSPCQSFSIAGKQQGAEEGSGTASSLMWETINIIKQMGMWKPKVVIWENVKNVLSKHMIHNFNKYLTEMEKLGYTNSFEVLDARDFGIPQSRQRIFTISLLGNQKFDFDNLEKLPMRNISEFLETSFGEQHKVTQPSMLSKIEHCDKGGFKVPIIKDCCGTITTKQMRAPNAGVIEYAPNQYRYLTERECWRLQGFTYEDFENAAKVNPGKSGCMNSALYKQAGNSIVIPVLEALFKELLIGYRIKEK